MRIAELLARIRRPSGRRSKNVQDSSAPEAVLAEVDALFSAIQDQFPRTASGERIVWLESESEQALRNAESLAASVARGADEVAAQVGWLNVGYARSLRGALADAVEAYDAAYKGPDLERSAEAGLALAGALWKLGNRYAGERMYHEVLASPASWRIRPQALYELAGALMTYRPDRAGGFFRKAIATGDPEYAPLSALALAKHEENQGRLDEAEQAFLDAINTGHQHVSPEAAYRLGVLRQERQDVAGAKEALGQALRSAHPRFALIAAKELIQMLEDVDWESARSAYDQAIDLNEPSDAPRLAFELGVKLKEREDLAGAHEALTRAISFEDGVWSEKARVVLSMLDEPAAEIAEPTDDERSGFLDTAAGSTAKGAHEDRARVADTLDRRSDALEERSDLLDDEASLRHSTSADPNRVFISHASEDKESVARPLAAALTARGWDVWYDEYSLVVGDSLHEVINKGLRAARFGVVVLSRRFFAKRWTNWELNALVAKEATDGSQMILPVWHGVGIHDVAEFNPMLADRLAVTTRDGIAALAEKLSDAMNAHAGTAVTGSAGRRPLLTGVPDDPATWRVNDESLRLHPGASLVELPFDRRGLLDELKRLQTDDFDEVLFRLGVPSAALPPRASTTAAAMAVVRYVGPNRYGELRSAIETVVKATSRRTAPGDQVTE